MLEVSRSGYYEWLGRKPSLRRQQDQALKRRLLSLHQRYPALGLDSLYHLIRSELACSRKRIHRLMNELNISSARKRAYKATTNSRHAHPIAPNLLARQFSFDAPNKAWVGDITYIPTDEGWLYCAIVKDLCTKQIIGYAFSERIDTNLTLAALNAAVRRRQPDPGLIFHSDRGVQYAACAYRLRLSELGIRQSMSRKYNSSGYLDMTAYLALRQVQREERAAKKVHTRKTPVGVWLASTERVGVGSDVKAVRKQ